MQRSSIEKPGPVHLHVQGQDDGRCWLSGAHPRSGVDLGHHAESMSAQGAAAQVGICHWCDFQSHLWVKVLQRLLRVHHTEM